MRFSLALSVAGFVLCSAAGSAMAQQQPQQYYTSNGPAVYVPQTGQDYYSAQGNGQVPFYNNTAQPLPMDQMIAGKNAPSYSYKGQKPYNLAPASSGNGALSPDEVYQLRAARDARSQQYQNEYMQSLAERDAAAGGYGQQAANTAQSYYNNILPKEEPKVKKKKRLVYREDANPLQAPPRLFDPDQ